MNTIKELLEGISAKTLWSDYTIAEKLDVSQATVWRYRMGVTCESRCPVGLLKGAAALYKTVKKEKKK